VLPDGFLERMRRLLGEEFAGFAAAIQAERTNSLHVNTLKLEPSEIGSFLSANLESVPWCDAGFYVSFEARVGSSLAHALGLIYVQEASAMAVAQVLGPEPNDRVLDLCAAPGGKTTQIAALMRAQGLLVANEINASRARILEENLERLGAQGIVTNEDPARLARAWPAYFDRVLVDAPCSGEGMFRKNPDAAQEWRPELVMACARRQTEILESAAVLLKPGGTLVYSTCTFAPEENEAVIARFLETHTEFEMLEIAGFSSGRPDWADGSPEIARAARLWPHLLRGEGHFIARLVKRDGDAYRVPLERVQVLSGKTKALWREFAQRYTIPDDEITIFRERIERIHPETPSLEGIKALRVGTKLAQVKADRLEPEHALTHALERHAEVPTLDLGPDDPRVAAFLRGESLEVTEDVPDGWIVVRAHGFGLGWGKRVGHTVKNHYPKGLRGALRTVLVED
jgi:NOL1/NOP2/sun family putative RNA methylase